VGRSRALPSPWRLEVGTAAGRGERGRADRGWAVHHRPGERLPAWDPAFHQADGLAPLGGLFQRITITLGWAWLTLLALHLLGGTGARPWR